MGANGGQRTQSDAVSLVDLRLKGLKMDNQYQQSINWWIIGMAH